jgi:hypothetical protein
MAAVVFSGGALVGRHTMYEAARDKVGHVSSSSRASLLSIQFV